MKVLHKVIIKANTVTKNNTMYSTEVCEKMVEQINAPNRLCASTFETGDLYPNSINVEVDYSEIAAKVENAKLENDKVTADITILETPSGDMLKSLLKLCGDDSIVFRPKGVVNYKEREDGIKEIDEFKLISISALHKQDDSLN